MGRCKQMYRLGIVPNSQLDLTEPNSAMHRGMARWRPVSETRFVEKDFAFLKHSSLQQAPVVDILTYSHKLLHLLALHTRLKLSLLCGGKTVDGLAKLLSLIPKGTNPSMLMISVG